MSSATLASPVSTNVGLGQIALCHPGERLTTVLGSCIGLVLYHPRVRVGVMAHIVLPASEGRDGPPGKFADTAIDAMLKELALENVPGAGLCAKLSGGASMFGGGGPLQVGEANAAAVKKELDKRHIRVSGEHIGGAKGRRVAFEAQSGEYRVEIAGQSSILL